MSKLSPTIAVSPLATISPTAGAVQDFSKPVIYTLTAEDGSTATYTANISRVKRTEKAIISFVVGGVAATIEETAKTISLSVPTGTDLSKLSPTIAVSSLATISPATGIIQDFSKPVIYTLIAEDGSKSTYTATITLPVKILDVNFENALMELKIDDKQDGELSRASAEKVLSLNLNNKKISSLKGIEAFTNLKTLNCSSNYSQLTNIDVSKNTALTFLECSYNQLTNIDVSKNTALTELYCHKNQLTSIDVSKNLALTTLEFVLEL